MFLSIVIGNFFSYCSNRVDLNILYNDENLRKEFGRAGREKVEKLYNWDVVGKQWCDLVDEVIK